MRSRKRRQLTLAELRAIGATPGLMARRYDADGPARLKQLAPEGSERRRDLIRRFLTDENDPRDGEALLEPTYAESVRRYNAGREAENRRACADYHHQQAERIRATLSGLIASHEERALKVLEDDSETKEGA
jgi:hypothetical protein